MDNKKTKIFTKEIIRAILKRRPKVNDTFIIVSKLMEAHEMKQYTELAEKLILAKEVDDDFLKDHVMIDFLSGDMWLDEIALNYYKDILTGYIDTEKYDDFLKSVEAQEDANRLYNQTLRMYREKSIAQLIKNIHQIKGYKSQYPSQVKIIKTWCLLEILSRTQLPKLFYKIKELPVKIKVRISDNRISKRLLAEIR